MDSPSIKTLLVFALFSFGLSPPAVADIPAINVLPEAVFAPEGLTEDDDIKLLITGTYTNSCYRAIPLESNIDLTRREIFLNNRATYASGSFCLMYLVPYAQSAALGRLPVGVYSILAQSPSGVWKVLSTLTISTYRGPGPMYEHNPLFGSEESDGESSLTDSKYSEPTTSQTKDESEHSP